MTERAGYYDRNSVLFNRNICYPGLGSQIQPKNVHGSGLAFATADVPVRSSMSMLPHVVSVRMYDADDHQVVS